MVAVAFLHALDLAMRLAQTSDSAQSFVAGYAVAQGNTLLSGWHFPFDNYYVTDTLPYAALERIAGPNPFLLALVPAIAYAVFLCVALALAVGVCRPWERRILAIAALALVLASPAWIGSWNPLLMSGLHFATVLMALVALWMCSIVAQSGRGSGPVFLGRCAGLLVLVSAVIASDAFCLVFAFGPAFVVLAADVAFGGAQPRARLALLLLGLGMALGMAELALVAHAGGFTIESHVRTGVVPAPLLERNLVALVGSILSLFGANPFGVEFTASTVFPFVLHATALVLALVAAARVAVRFFRASLLDRFLFAGTIAVLVACAVSWQFGKGIAAETMWTGGPPMRYAMPAFLFASLLAASELPNVFAGIRSAALRSAACMALTCLAVLAVVAGEIGPMPPRGQANAPAANVARWLEASGLKQGVGEYWAANLVTALSGEAVEVRSVVPDDGRLVPYVWSSDAAWYRQPPQFAIWQDRNLTGVTYDSVRATYTIGHVARVGDYRIAIIRYPTNSRGR